MDEMVENEKLRRRDVGAIEDLPHRGIAELAYRADPVNDSEIGRGKFLFPVVFPLFGSRFHDVIISVVLQSVEVKFSPRELRRREKSEISHPCRGRRALLRRDPPDPCGAVEFYCIKFTYAI